MNQLKPKQSPVVEKGELAEVFDITAERTIRYGNLPSRKRTDLSTFFTTEIQVRRDAFEAFIKTLPQQVGWKDISKSCDINYAGIFHDLENKIVPDIIDETEIGTLNNYFNQILRICIREAATKFKLHPYQYESLANIQRGIDKNKKTFLIQLPTGTGKTIAFSYLREYLGHNGKTLILAHRDQLLSQALKKKNIINPELNICIVDGHTKSLDPDTHIVIASVPSLGRGENSKKLSWLIPKEINLIITDEAHHATADSYRRIYEYLLEGNEEVEGNPNIIHVGFTATPIRGDKQDLSKVFPELTYSMSLRQAIADGWLARVIGYRVNTDIDLTDVKSGIGDLNLEDLELAVNIPERNQRVVKAYLDHAKGKKTLVFAVDRQHSKDLRDMFLKHNIKAVHVDGTTPHDELENYINQLVHGEINVIVNCNLLTEGFDCPELEAIIMARPTESALLYEQMLGRGTRKIEGKKEEMILIDMVDNTQKHSLIDAAKIFGVTGDKKEGDLVQLVEDEENRQSQALKDRVITMKVQNENFDSQKLNLFGEYPEIEDSPIYFVGKQGSFMVNLFGEAIRLAEGIVGWTVILPDENRESYENLQMAVDFIEHWLKTNRWDKKFYWHKSFIKWMNKPATEGQYKYLGNIPRFWEKYYPEYAQMIRDQQMTFSAANMILSDHNQSRTERNLSPATEKQIKYLRIRLKTLRHIKGKNFSLDELTCADAYNIIQFCKNNGIPPDWELTLATAQQVDELCLLESPDKRAYYAQLPHQAADYLIGVKKARLNR